MKKFNEFTERKDARTQLLRAYYMLQKELTMLLLRRRRRSHVLVKKCVADGGENALRLQSVVESIRVRRSASNADQILFFLYSVLDESYGGANYMAVEASNVVEPPHHCLHEFRPTVVVPLVSSDLCLDAFLDHSEPLIVHAIAAFGRHGVASYGTIVVHDLHKIDQAFFIVMAGVLIVLSFEQVWPSSVGTILLWWWFQHTLVKPTFKSADRNDAANSYKLLYIPANNFDAGQRYVFILQFSLSLSKELKRKPTREV